MADIKQAFGSSTTITITLASLAANAYRSSLAVDNGTDKFLDALVQVKVKKASGSPAGSKVIDIYAYGSEDGTKYTDVVTGVDAVITPTFRNNLKLLVSIKATTANQEYISDPLSIASAFGGVMPRKWGIIVENNDDSVAFSSTGGDHEVKYTGIFATSI